MLTNSIFCGIMSIYSILSDTTITKECFEKQNLSIEMGVNIPSNSQNPFFIRTLRYGTVDSDAYSNQNSLYIKLPILNTKKKFNKI